MGASFDDNVSHPTQYKSKSGPETINAIAAFTEDPEKARWYMNRLIDELKDKEASK